MSHAQNHQHKDPIVNVMLTGGRVTSSFRAELFAATDRAGMSVNEFVLQAAAEKLQRAGRAFAGPFHRNDIGGLNGGMGA